MRLNRSSTFLVGHALVFILLATSGCREEKQAARPQNEIARVGQASITQEEFQALLNMRSANGMAARYSSKEGKQALLDELIRREATLNKAKAAGFDQRPDIQDAVKRLIASKYEEEHFKHDETEEFAVSDKEVEDYYEKNIERYGAPAKARAAIILLKVSPLAPAEKRKEITEKAQAILDKAKEASLTEFARLAVENSEDQASRYRSGDIGWVSRVSALDPHVTEALFALKTPGEFAPLVTAHNGIYIVKLLDTKPSGTRPLSEVKDAIVYNIRREKKAKHEQDFYSVMKSGLDIQINQPLLDSIHPAPSSPSEPPTTPGAVAQQ